MELQLRPTHVITMWDIKLIHLHIESAILFFPSFLPIVLSAFGSWMLLLSLDLYLSNTVVCSSFVFLMPVYLRCSWLVTCCEHRPLSTHLWIHREILSWQLPLSEHLARLQLLYSTGLMKGSLYALYMWLSSVCMRVKWERQRKLYSVACGFVEH